MSGLVLSPALVAAGIALLFGLVVGSFANVVIHRLPLEQSIVSPPSRCPRCGAAIRPWQNIPVFSWLFLRGRCASCREPISARYPMVEAVHGLGFGLIVAEFGPFPFTLLLLVFFSAMVILALIDWDHQILPDVITLPGIVVGIAGTFLPGALIDWKESALSALFGYVAFFLVAESYARLRGIEGLGQGDWKLAAMMGTFLGGQRLMLTVFLGSVSGMIFGLIQAWRQRRAEFAAEPLGDALAEVEPLALEVVGPEANEAGPSSPESQPPENAPSVAPVPIGKFRLPFGTFLAASAIFVLFRGDRLLIWYASLFRY
ncbi:MAG: prepilin peptidase [Vicinamibacteria bacterium]|jgi:leader peptidase (prepilin peptidase)/N-methyltransferase|nr:prepilin peptidase [Vicinamibacteria bacterium]